MRGKNAASAAKRRAEQASEEVAALKRRLAESEQSHRSQIVDLRAQIARLQSSLNSEVRTIAQAELWHAREVYTEEFEKYLKTGKKRSEDVARFFNEKAEKYGWALTPEEWKEFCQIIDMKLGEVVSGHSSNRATKRARTKKMNLVENALNQHGPSAFHDLGHNR